MLDPRRHPGGSLNRFLPTAHVVKRLTRAQKLGLAAQPCRVPRHRRHHGEPRRKSQLPTRITGKSRLRSRHQPPASTRARASARSRSQVSSAGSTTQRAVRCSTCASRSLTRASPTQTARCADSRASPTWSSTSRSRKTWASRRRRAASCGTGFTSSAGAEAGLRRSPSRVRRPVAGQPLDWCVRVAV